MACREGEAYSLSSNGTPLAGEFIRNFDYFSEITSIFMPLAEPGGLFIIKVGRKTYFYGK
jgi:hypothetical protein